MSVSNVAVKQRYSANGVQTSFAIPFAFIPGNASAVTKVYKVTYDAAGVATETLQVEGSSNDYILDPPYNASTGIDNQNVIFNSAPASGGQVLVIRQMDLKQLQSFVGNPQYFKNVENALDILTFLVQQLDEKIQRAPKYRVSGTDNDIPLPDVPTGARYIWTYNELGEIELLVPSDVPFQAAFIGFDRFSISMNTSGNILAGYSFDGVIYSSVILEYEIQQGTTVFVNGSTQLQYLKDGSANGLWQLVPRSEYDNGTPTGVQFAIQQTTTMVQLLAAETGVGDAEIKIKRMYFLQ